MNLYFFAPWIILAFMIAVVITTLMVVHFLITLCLVDDEDKDHHHQHYHQQQHRKQQQQINSYHETFSDNPIGKSNPHQLPSIEPMRGKKSPKTGGGGHLKLPMAPWIKWGRQPSRSDRKKRDKQIDSYIRSSSFCDLSVTSSSYQPYNTSSTWVISSPEMYQRSAYHPDEMDSNPNEEGNIINIGKLRNHHHHHSSYDSLTTTATTDTEFYRDWNHSIEFTEFNELYYNTNLDPKYKDTNQNVIYI